MSESPGLRDAPAEFNRGKGWSGVGCDPLRQRSHLVDDLALGREPSFILLGKDALSVDADDEDPAAAADDLAVDAEFAFYLSRQTGGSREVVSNAAVVDSNMHEK